MFGKFYQFTPQRQGALKGSHENGTSRNHDRAVGTGLNSNDQRGRNHHLPGAGDASAPLHRQLQQLSVPPGGRAQLQQLKNPMKIIIQSVVAIAAVCLLAGCETTGLSPRETSGVSYPNYVFSLPSGNAAPQKLTVPIRLAVAQVGEDTPSEALLAKLAGHTALVASVTGLPLPADRINPYYRGRFNSPAPDYAARVKSLCGLARAAGADYVFLYGGSIDTWEQKNPLSVLDLTIIGGVLMPGTKIHAEGKGAGVLISAATCEPVLFVNTDTKNSATSPDFLTQGKTIGLQANIRDQLAAKLTDQLLDQLACAAVR